MASTSSHHFRNGPPGPYYDTAMLIGPAGEVIANTAKLTRRLCSASKKSTFAAVRLSGFRVGDDHRHSPPATTTCFRVVPGAGVNGAELIIAPYATPVATRGRIPHNRALETRVFRGLQSRGPGRRVADVRQEHDHHPLADRGQGHDVDEHIVLAEFDRQQVISAAAVPLFATAARCVRRHRPRQ